ncbi:serine hydrolase domain-containing protein [Streptomyces sp. NRRL WC-3742]|uniref:serine hydrolase domain-containing protein n=1 Tax=Streptomyces sp. NRRL WC-3742 TaxID=1463934 RepID=UPI00099B7B89|nr:serine hydrolase domain-containing protein [Streptomyces sp. NRRL WC-3742]
MTHQTRRPRPAAHRSVRAASAALALTGLLTTAACSGSSKPAEPAAGAVVTAAPAALSPSPSTAASSGGAVVPFTPDVTSRLDTAIKQTMSQVGVPGVIVGLTTPDGSYQRAFGVADKTSGTPMSPDLYMRVGSVTKTMTATAVLQLVDQGKVGLDDPISKYVQGVPGGDKISVRDLGDMRSGLYSYSFDPDFQHALFSDPKRPFTPDELLAYAFKHPANFPPGTQYEYSNTNAVLLGVLVEKLTGKSLTDVLGQQVFGPVGMTKTNLPTDAAFPTPHAHGYTNQTLNGDVQDSTDWNPSWGWAAGAAISTLSDLQTWAKVLATGDPLIKPATQAERLKYRGVGTPDLGYGFGIFTTHGWVGHNGSLPGYQSVVMYLPEAKATMVVLLNTDISHEGSEPSTFLARAITQIFSPNNVYTLPTPPASGSASPSASAASPSASPSTASPSAIEPRPSLGTLTPAPSGSAKLSDEEESDS